MIIFISSISANIINNNKQNPTSVGNLCGGRIMDQNFTMSIMIDDGNNYERMKEKMGKLKNMLQITHNYNVLI